MKKILIFSLIICSFCFAVFEDMESGARADGMADAMTAVADDASAIQFNPAGLYQIENISVMSFYKLLFGGVGVNLHDACINLAYPINKKAGVVGVSLQEMGISLNSERVVSFSHGFSLVRDIYFGYSLRGYSLYQQGFGTGYNLGLDLGVMTKVYKRWQAGFFVHNINNPKLGTDVKYALPRMINFGVAYRPTSGITSALDISKEVGKPTRILIGQEFQIIEDYLTVRAGIQTEPIRFAFGIRSGMKNIFIDYAVTTHPDLPLTHNFGLAISF
jgi:hypothetical protein